MQMVSRYCVLQDNNKILTNLVNITCHLDITEKSTEPDHSQITCTGTYRFYDKKKPYKGNRKKLCTYSQRLLQLLLLIYMDP